MSLFRRRLMEGFHQQKYIRFRDPAVRAWALAHFDKDGDGRISYKEAQNVTDEEFQAAGIGKIAFDYFDEFRFFTKITKVTQYFGRKKANSITFPSVPLQINYVSAYNVHISSEISGRLRVDNLFVKDNAVIKSLNICNINKYILKNSTFYSVEGEMLLSKDKTRLYAFTNIQLGDVIVPAYVTRIESMAILSAKLTSVVVPSSVTHIGSHFSSPSVELMDIGENVDTLHAYIGYNSIKLKKIIFRGRIKNFYSNKQQSFFQLTHQFDIFVRDDDIEYYKGLFKAPYNSYVKSINEMI